MSVPSGSAEPLILTQLSTRLHDLFNGHIPLGDVAKKPPDQLEQFFRTRALCALFLMKEANLSAAAAGGCITDGGSDDGIDAVYVDTSKSVIYFVQSKWRRDMNKGIQLPDITRFRDGVRDVIAQQWTANNANIHAFKSAINAQLNNIDTTIVMVLAHTSDQPIDTGTQDKIDKFIAEQNQYNSDFIEFREFRIEQAVHAARSLTRPENIDVEVMLSNWGAITQPFPAVYGSIAALDVVSWFEKNGNKLFAENLRYGIEKSDVNEGIIQTATSAPHHFWYFNNGITAICETFHKRPMGGPDTSSGVFDVSRVSVINGAQTITSLSKAKAAGTELSKIRVQIRIISVQGTPEDFSKRITSANNTQNDLNPVDFVAGDDNQERIRKEAAALQVAYTFRRGDSEPTPELGFNIRSATIAAACASGDFRLAVAAKRYISGLWENTKKEPYTKLFNSSTSAVYLWNAVRIMRTVDEELARLGSTLTGRERLTTVHGNRFILFYVFNKLKGRFENNNSDFSSVLSDAAELTSKATTALNAAIASLFPEAYPGNIFKNQERQLELLARL